MKRRGRGRRRRRNAPGNTGTTAAIVTTREDTDLAVARTTENAAIIETVRDRATGGGTATETAIGAGIARGAASTNDGTTATTVQESADLATSTPTHVRGNQGRDATQEADRLTGEDVTEIISLLFHAFVSFTTCTPPGYTAFQYRSE
jgi:hypothetical protein